MSQHMGAVLWKNLQIHQVLGANTHVGKTIFSTLLCRGANRSTLYERVFYLKPVSTGPREESDIRHIERFAPQITPQHIYQFAEPISPHLAASEHVPDSLLLRKIRATISQNAKEGCGFMIVEGAGGPHSPGPSGTSQVQLYRALRLPCILIADSNLGGISTSISAFESVLLHGYDVDAVAIFENQTYKNHEYLCQYFQDRGITFVTIPYPPEQASSEDGDARNMNLYYQEHEPVIQQVISQLRTKHTSKIEKLQNMAETAHKHIWYPFTQHKNMRPSDLTVIDSALGDYFQTYRDNGNKDLGLLRSSYDGSASWWTQGLGHGNHNLSTAAANAAGRYGHVMFASAIHEPAVSLAQKLLVYLKNPKLNRVFFSDNGSTGMEVAVKMALKATSHRYQLGDSHKELQILGLRNSYHGDTLGTVDMSEPSVYNDQISWYRGRGYWFDSPSVKMIEGKWVIQKPTDLADMCAGESSFDSLQDIFDRSRDITEEARIYRQYISQVLERLGRNQKDRFGALVMEPIVLGAGGMVLVYGVLRPSFSVSTNVSSRDPLFQRTLTEVVRECANLLFSAPPVDEQGAASELSWKGLPVVTDEVFTGLYRLGHATSSSLLQILPDISVHAKLLTGGLLPLATTVASEEIFRAFLGDSKADSLLHGHSYTAHAVGCAVANASLDLLEKQEVDGRYDASKNDWISSRGVFAELAHSLKDASTSLLPGSDKLSQTPTSPQVWSVWSKAFVARLSHAKRIEGVWALGSVLSITIRDDSGSGYTSDAAMATRDQLFQHDETDWNIHSRVLGNVLYLMTSQVTSGVDVRLWEERLETVLCTR